MKTRGIIDPVTLVLVAGLAGGFVLGSWRPLAMFRKKPPTEQLTKLQGELEQAQRAAKQAEADKQAAVAQERAKLEAQVRSAQADNLGTQTALKKVPAAHQTPEVRVATRMANRVSLKLASAIGNLPESERDGMIELIDQLLSEKQAEVDEANRKLAEADSRFKATTEEREQLKAQIPVLAEKARKAEENAQSVQSEVTAKTEEVKKTAQKLYDEQKASGSLASSVKNGLLLLGAAYLFITFGIPGIIKHMATENPAKHVLRDLAGYLSSPLIYMDAKKKIAGATAQKEKDEANAAS